MIQATLELLTTGNSELIAQELKTLYNTPTIGLPVATSALNGLSNLAQSSVFSLLVTGSPTKRGIPIYTTKLTESIDAQIGQQMMLRALGGVQVVTDNYAPLPRVWKIEGYIKPISLNFGTLAGFSAISNLVGTATQKSILTVIKWYFRALRDTRTPFYFFTKEGEKVKALFKNIQFIDLPEADNVQPVSLEVHEYMALELQGSGDTATQAVPAGNTPPLGSLFTKGNSVATTALVNLINKPASNMWEDPSYVVSEVIGSSPTNVGKGIYDLSEKSTVQVAKFMSRAVKSAIAHVSISHNVFMNMVYKDEGGAAKHYSNIETDLSTEFGSITVALEEIVPSLAEDYANLAKKEWWIKETHTNKDTEEEKSFYSRVAFGVPLHPEQEWSTMLVSNYDVDELSELTDAQQIEALSSMSVVTVWN